MPQVGDKFKGKKTGKIYVVTGIDDRMTFLEGKTVWVGCSQIKKI